MFRVCSGCALGVFRDQIKTKLLYSFKKKSGACSGSVYRVCVPGVLFCFISFEKTGVCSGFVPGVLFLLHFFLKKSGVCSGCVVIASFF